MQIRLILFSVLAAVILPPSGRAGATQPVPRVEAVACSTLTQIPPDQKASCGYLIVPEDRSKPKSSLIRLPFVRQHSRSASPAPDPVIFMLGGPGNSIIGPSMGGWGNPILAHRDFIRFEQRGSLRALPSLPCDEFRLVGERSARGELSDQAARRQQLAVAAECAAEARGRGVNLSKYNSVESARDIEDLRRALNLPAVNLLGLSYSARIMMNVARYFPQGVRSIALDSPLSHEANYDESAAAGTLRVLDLMVAQCSTDPVCGHRFPRIRQQLREVIERAAAEPVRVRVTASDNQQIDVLVDGKGMANALLGALYSPEMAEQLPLFIDQIHRRAYTPLRDLIDVEGSKRAWLLRLAVWCNEEMPFESPALIKSQIGTLPAEFQGLDWGTVPEGACEAIGLGNARPPANENEPVASDVPALVINGEVDPATPPSWGRAMLKHLPNGRHLVVPGAGHATFFSGPCPPAIISAFYISPSSPLDASCIMKMPGLDFSKAAARDLPAGSRQKS